MQFVRSACANTCSPGRDDRGCRRSAQPSGDAGFLQYSVTPLRSLPSRSDVPEATLADLKTRLARTRFAGEIPGSGWEYGTDLTYLRQLLAYWRDEFDWREQGARSQPVRSIQDAD